MSAPRIDLHTHSNASDGTLPPAGVMHRAARHVDVVALTDHDTTAGWAAAAAALPAGLSLVRGLELSCHGADPDGRRISLHLLGYLVDPEDQRLVDRLAALRESRLTRARRMVEAIAADGYDVSWEQVTRLAAGGTVGRPHVARALIEAGEIDTVDEAFAPEWIATRGRYYVEKDEVPVLEGIALVRAAGGVPVFAHPRATKRGRVVADDTIAAMAAAGLAALEIDHPDHSDAERAHLRGLAADLGLLVTGSSDFHGEAKPQDIGALTTDPEVYEALVAQATGVPVLTG